MSARGTQHGMNRRTVTRGAAWSVPLVAVSVAAPAFAASDIIVNPVLRIDRADRVGDLCTNSMVVTGLAPSTQYRYLNTYSSSGQYGADFTTNSSGEGEWSNTEPLDDTWTTQIFDVNGQPVGPTQPVSSPQQMFISIC